LNNQAYHTRKRRKGGKGKREVEGKQKEGRKEGRKH
jgi:hypothetical protein